MTFFVVVIIILFLFFLLFKFGQWLLFCVHLKILSESNSVTVCVKATAVWKEGDRGQMQDLQDTEG